MTDLFPMSPEEVSSALDGLNADASDAWHLAGDRIQCTYSFDDFEGAMAFANAVAQTAEKQQHHPDMLIRYSRVTLTLSTHDAGESGGITDKDFELARAVNVIVSDG